MWRCRFARQIGFILTERERGRSNSASLPFLSCLELFGGLRLRNARSLFQPCSGAVALLEAGTAAGVAALGERGRLISTAAVAAYQLLRLRWASGMLARSAGSSLSEGPKMQITILEWVRKRTCSDFTAAMRMGKQCCASNSRGGAPAELRGQPASVLGSDGGVRECALLGTREIEKLGHEVRLIGPRFVKPYVKANKHRRVSCCSRQSILLPGVCYACSPELSFRARASVTRPSSTVIALSRRRGKAVSASLQRFSKETLRSGGSSPKARNMARCADGPSKIARG